MSDVRVIERERRDRLGEGLLWSARETALYWVDILGARVNRLDLASGRVDDWSMPDTIGWLIEREQGGFVAGLGRAFVALSFDPLVIETIVAPEPERDGNRFNDAKADAAGRIWAGSMPLTCDRPSGAFYRLDPDGRATRIENGYTTPTVPRSATASCSTPTPRSTRSSAIRSMTMAASARASRISCSSPIGVIPTA
jgi:sugar lactone lactonase YvrE